MNTILSRVSVMVIAIALLSLNLVSCGGGGGGGADDVQGPPPSGTGAGGVTTFWSIYGTGFGGGQSVQETSDGGFILAGYVTPDFSAAPSDWYVAKTDAGGNVQWQKTFGGTGRDTGRSIQQATDGGYIVAGCFDCDTSPRSFYLLKLDGSGNKVWEKAIPGSSLDGAYDVQETRSGATPDGYIVVGSDVSQGVALIKTDLSGTVTWQRSFASRAGWDVGFFAQQTTDDGYVIAGAYAGEIGLIKTDASGTEKWSKNFGTGWASSVKQTADGGYVLAGRTSLSPSFGGTVPGDAVVIKTDKDGNQVWRKTFGGVEDDEANSVALTLDGGYVIAGRTLSYGPGPVDYNQPWQWEDVFLIKLDANGNTVWQKVKGHRPNSSDGAASVAAVSDGGYIVTGNSNAYPSGTILLAKFDRNGDTVNLGENDLSITVPGVSGIINFTNAIDVAAAGVRGLLLPYDVGTTSLDLLIDVATGATVSSFCSGGGSYSAALNPAGPVAMGSVLSGTFTNCVNGPAGSERMLNGDLTLTVDSISGSFSSEYTIHTTISPINVTSSESGGSLTNTTTGGMQFSRQSVSGNYTELAQSITTPSPDTLMFSETEGGITVTRAVGPFELHDSVSSSGGYSYGATGETVTVDPGSISGVLTVTVLQPISGSQGSAPTSGSLRITAEDNSRITAVITSTGITLAIDTDADGTDDGTISTTWDFLY